MIRILIEVVLIIAGVIGGVLGHRWFAERAKTLTQSAAEAAKKL